MIRTLPDPSTILYTKTVLAASGCLYCDLAGSQHYRLHNFFVLEAYSGIMNG